ncbi:MAG: IDEAL domain-containing protein [Bacilli bacterium]
MKNEKPFSDMVKSSLHKQTRTSANDTAQMLIQMIIDEALLVRKKALLEEAIDKALACRDEEAFLTLSSEYKEVMKYF